MSSWHSMQEVIEGVGVLALLGDLNERRVDPPAGFDAVQAANNELELLVEVVVKILNGAVMGCNIDAFDAAHNKLGGDLGLGLAYVGLSKEELSVEVRDIDGV
ncbi:hypothetical protein ColLi_03092 [Colletotrichum liriopes]|uniref:Uncharacterized protein n=1 Tax=Colletotrichum liriopes TaxID=708192 RepID=A0AA37GGE8_9PEZI|nr:hypothetical protein ColLi_03092 [Colletotrichum liriopes]